MFMVVELLRIVNGCCKPFLCPCFFSTFVIQECDGRCCIVAKALSFFTSCMQSEGHLVLPNRTILKDTWEGMPAACNQMMFHHFKAYESHFKVDPIWKAWRTFLGLPSPACLIGDPTHLSPASSKNSKIPRGPSSSLEGVPGRRDPR